MSDVTVTLAYTPDEATRVAHLIERVDRSTALAYDDHDRLLLISSAIRRANKPPKLEEPLGLGAVVEDADGQRWVRVVPRIGYFCWQSLDTDQRAAKWRGIDAVRILSPGVTEDGAA